MKLNIKEKSMFVVVLVAHVAFQLININKWNVWHDESFTSMLVRYNWGELLERAARDVHPPLYYLLLKGWGSIFGMSITSLRLFSVACSVAAIVLGYCLVRRLFNRSAALVALPFLGLAPFVMRYGWEMRMYTLAMLFILINTHIFVSLVRKKSAHKLLWLGYMITLAAAIYTHYYAGLTLAVQGVYLLYLNSSAIPEWWTPANLVQSVRSIAAKWWLAWAGIVALLAPWLPTVYRQTSEIQGAFWIRPVSHESFYSTLTSLLFFRESYVLEGRYAFMGLIVVTAFVVLVRKVWITEEKYRKNLVLLGLFTLVPMALLFLSSLVLQPTYFDRYFTLFAFAFYGLLGVAVYCMFASKYWTVVARAAIFAVLATAIVIGNVRIFQYGDFDGDHSRFTMKTIMEYVDVNYEPGSALVTAGLWTYFDARDYNETGQEVQVYIPYELEKGMGNATLIYQRDDLIVKDLETAFRPGQKVWYFTETSKTFDEVPDTWRETGKTFELGYAKVSQFIVY